MCEPKNFYVWLLEFIGLLGLLAFILWLALRPKPPSYSIDFVSIPQSSDQNGTIIYNLEIENPNKESSISYDDITVSFLYGQDQVAQSTIGSFRQRAGKSNSMFQSTNANGRALKPLVNAISNATAELKAALKTRFRYKTWGIKSKFHGVNLQGTLPIGPGGKLSGKKKKYPIKSPSKKTTRFKIKH
ncbi:NDR1/HIN1-like protein 2 [Neltuma alba]|uniref:NDR1/HIN1-like protein 2 n=1 Tax=Neltuma alba TaxID=207710 RepID=UPI0010A3D96E|nr:NDR1/HIN1-like protein 2 [Prosopis alba]XP_028788538.1 NDR1/HIN1-like protein 2 [Prosopis alba]